MHFRLVEAAEGEHGNVKAPEGKNRVFVLAPPGDSRHEFIGYEDGEQGKELIIRFEYRPATPNDRPEEDRVGNQKAPAQKELNRYNTRHVFAVATRH